MSIRCGDCKFAHAPIAVDWGMRHDGTALGPLSVQRMGVVDMQVGEVGVIASGRRWQCVRAVAAHDANAATANRGTLGLLCPDAVIRGATQPFVLKRSVDEGRPWKRMKCLQRA